MRSNWPLLGLLLALGALVAVPGPSPWTIRAGRGRAVEDSDHQLGSPSFEQRRRARNLLLSLGEDSRPALESALRSEDAEVRQQAAAALRGMRTRERTPFERLAREYRSVVRFALDLPAELVPGSESRRALAVDPRAAARAAGEVAGRLRHRPELEVRAVNLLHEIGRTEGTLSLARILRRGDCLPSLLHDAAEGLIAFGGEDSLPDLREAARGSDRAARREALRALAFLGGAEDAGLARSSLGDGDARVRAQAAQTLASLGGRKARADLAAALGDPDAAVRRAAVTALGAIGDHRDMAAVRKLFADPAAEVRAAAVAAIAQLTSPSEAVEAGIRDTSPTVRRAALAASRFLPLRDRRRALLGTGAEPDPGLHELRRKMLALGRAD